MKATRGRSRLYLSLECRLALPGLVQRGWGWAAMWLEDPWAVARDPESASLGTGGVGGWVAPWVVTVLFPSGRRSLKPQRGPGCQWGKPLGQVCCPLDEEQHGGRGMVGPRGGGRGVHSPSLPRAPFRGAELGPSTSPHSLETEAPGSMHGGSAQGQKLGLGTPRQPEKDSHETRPAPSVVSTLAEANLNHGELAKEKRSWRNHGIQLP